jgi:hypothetical protein
MMDFWSKLTIQRLMAAVLFILLFAMAVRIPTDTDTWWHIRSGEYMVENREILRSDPFSFTRYGEEWVDHSWGSQIIIYSFYHLFGGEGQPGDSGNIGLALFMAVLAVVGLIFVYLMCEGNVYIRAFALVLGAAAAAVFWSPRPQMFSFALSALVLYLLHLYKREQIDRLWLIPVILVFWVNLHGGFAIGFIFLFGSLFGEALGNFFNADDARVVRWDRLRKMALITALSIPAIVLNPYGVQMLAYPFRTVNIGVLQDFIQEWASPNFHQTQVWPFALLLLGVLAAVGLSTRRIDWTDLVLTGGTALMGLMAGRNIAVFAIVATPVLSRHVNAWLTERGWVIRPVRRVSGPMLVLNWVLLIVVLLGGLVKIAAALNESVMRDAQETYLPVEIAAFLDESPPPGKMFNSYNWGGYLMFAAPNVPVYVDGRTDLYDDDFLRDYLDVYFARDGWRESLDEQDIGFVAVEESSTLAKLLRTQPDTWKESLFDDEHSSLFVRITSDE